MRVKKSDAISLSKLKEIVSGQESQRKGLGFENDFEKLLEENGISNIRIPQSSKVVKDRKSDHLITIRQPGALDFILFSKGKSYLIDCKTTSKDFLYKYYFVKTSTKQKQTNTQDQYQKMSEIFKTSGFSNMGFLIKFNSRIKFISIKKMISHFKKNKTISFRAGVSLDEFIESVKQGKS